MDEIEFYQTVMQEQEYLEYLKTEVCLYCGEPKGEKIGCCGENHWGLGKDMV